MFSLESKWKEALSTFESLSLLITLIFCIQGDSVLTKDHITIGRVKGLRPCNGNREDREDFSAIKDFLIPELAFPSHQLEALLPWPLPHTNYLCNRLYPLLHMCITGVAWYTHTCTHTHRIYTSYINFSPFLHIMLSPSKLFDRFCHDQKSQVGSLIPPLSLSGNGAHTNIPFNMLVTGYTQKRS